MRLLRAAAALFLLTPLACQATEPSTRSAAGLQQVPLSIKTSVGKTHRFLVEVAATPAQQEKGLMFRTELGPDAGMIFPMVPPRHAAFWMRNTLIPLDMIFVRPDGSIARIAAMTAPHSLVPVYSGEPVAAVLEIAGGRAAALNIKEGDLVVWKR